MAVYPASYGYFLSSEKISKEDGTKIFSLEATLCLCFDFIIHVISINMATMQKWNDINTSISLFSSYQLNAHFLYSITIYMLHYNPQHVSSSTLLIVRRTNCIITASGIVTLCKLSPLSTGILYSCLQRVTIPEAVIIQFVLLKMSKVLLKTCCGL